MSMGSLFNSLRPPEIILRAASMLVPRAQRAEWLAEWRGELWYIEHRRSALAFSLGAFKDARWMRSNAAPDSLSRVGWLGSPWRCLSMLAVIASCCVWLALVSSSPVWEIPERGRIAHCAMPLVALILLPAFATLSLGSYPLSGNSAACSRWGFLAAKTGLLLTIVFCGLLDLAALTSTPIQPHGLLVGYILALRWALIDQRKRCPVCLRRLTNPLRIGDSSHTFLAWHGTELVCDRGHGLLHVSEIESSSCNPYCWLNLDSSWGGLFASQKS